jgi:hypothetical protein
VINGQTLSEKFLSNLKEKYSNADLILYLWDSLSNRKNITKNLTKYHKVFTFDKCDSIKYNINFRPLFFTSFFNNSEKFLIEYDLSFIGTIHSDRYSVIKKIININSDKYKIFNYLYIQAFWVYLIYKIFNRDFRRASISDFKFIGLDKESINNIFLK